jgi:hypothetical protein
MEAAWKLEVSEDLNAFDEQTGTITFKFDPK